MLNALSHGVGLMLRRSMVDPDPFELTASLLQPMDYRGSGSGRRPGAHDCHLRPLRARTISTSNGVVPTCAISGIKERLACGAITGARALMMCRYRAGEFEASSAIWVGCGSVGASAAVVGPGHLGLFKLSGEIEADCLVVLHGIAITFGPRSDVDRQLLGVSID